VRPGVNGEATGCDQRVGRHREQWERGHSAGSRPVEEAHHAGHPRVGPVPAGVLVSATVR
jgi:hypothetical protein